MFLNCQQHQNPVNKYSISFNELYNNSAQFSPDWITALVDIGKYVPNGNLMSTSQLTLFVKCCSCGLYYSTNTNT